jgi:hypothetical protein
MGIIVSKHLIELTCRSDGNSTGNSGFVNKLTFRVTVIYWRGGGHIYVAAKKQNAFSFIPTRLFFLR